MSPDLFIDAMGTASPLEDAEACVYGYGALKFLTMNNQLLSHILDLGALDLMVLHLKIVNSTVRKNILSGAIIWYGVIFKNHELFKY